MMVRVVLVVILLGASAGAASGAPDGNQLAQALRALGERTLASLPPQVTGGDATWIAAVEPCDRPSADEVAALTEKVNKSMRRWAGGPVTLRVGCKERAGLLVETEFELREPTGAHRAWDVRVVREPDRWGDGVRELAENTMRKPQYDRRALVLVDLDGDGARDVVFTQDTQAFETGAPAVDLSMWSSKHEARFWIGEIEGTVEVAPGQPRAGSRVILQVAERRYGSTPVFRCLDSIPKPALGLCPAVEPARRFTTARATAALWAIADARGPLDRELLAEQMLALSAYGVTAADRSRILPLAEPAAPAAVISREVARALDRRIPHRHGEPVFPVIEARPALALALLGDAPCAALRAAETDEIKARLSTWIAQNLKHEHLFGPDVVDACVGRGQAYYVVAWSFRDHASANSWRVYRAIFHDRAGTLKPSVMLDLDAPADPACRMCRPTPPVDARLYRRGGSLVAVIGEPGKFTVEVDGAAVPPPPAASGVTYEIGHARVLDLIGVAGAPPQFFHWEGEGRWAPVATPADVHPRTPQPAFDPRRDAVALWLWQQARLDSAIDLLDHFSADAWQRDPDVRADVHQALVLAGADPAALKRASAAEALASK